ncbi:hypothetical protein NX059_003431 [Plenodomus lindquistii]|nr:hypothetical protein NX059_003431 [Plenodomus lindquistii]
MCAQPIITTHRLIVRVFQPQDNNSMSLNANNLLVTRSMSNSFPYPYTVSAADDWIAMNLAKSMQDNWVVSEKASPETNIGGIGLKYGVDVSSHTAEVGFWIGQNYWGKGYMTEVLEAFTRWTFMNQDPERPKTTRLVGHVFGGNIGSMRCFEKCGFTKEGVLKGHCEKNGEVKDLHIYGLIKADWEVRVSSVFNNY